MEAANRGLTTRRLENSIDFDHLHKGIDIADRS